MIDPKWKPLCANGMMGASLDSCGFARMTRFEGAEA